MSAEGKSERDWKYWGRLHITPVCNGLLYQFPYVFTKADYTQGKFCHWQQGNTIVCACCVWNVAWYILQLLANRQVVYFQVTCNVAPCADDRVASSPATKVASCMVCLSDCHHHMLVWNDDWLICPFINYCVDRVRCFTLHTDVCMWSKVVCFVFHHFSIVL